MKHKLYSILNQYTGRKGMAGGDICRDMMKLGTDEGSICVTTMVVEGENN